MDVALSILALIACGLTLELFAGSSLTDKETEMTGEVGRSLDEALIGNPRLLIVDEPTAGLDPEERVRFRNLLSEHARRRLVILSTHILPEVESVCDRVQILHHGATVFRAQPKCERPMRTPTPIEVASGT